MLSKLELITEACAKLDKRGILVHNERCLHTRHQQSSCLRCSTVCPSGAITFSEGLVYAAEKCTGCGACTSVCPSGALSAKLPTNEELHSLVKLHVDRSGAVAFACESFLASHPDERPRVVSLQCTARLDESILVDAVLSGASSVAVINASCGTCPQCSLCKLTQTMVVVANHLLECWQYPAAITLTQKIPDQIEPLPITEGEATGVTRRSFFTAFKGGGARFASQILPEVVAVAIGRRSQNPNALPSLKDQPKIVPEKWRLLFNSLRKLNAAPQTPEFESKLWGDITVNAKCNGCGGCSDVCPTAALMSIEQDGLWALFFEGSRCTQCGLCRDVCFQEGIELSPRIRLAPMLAQTPRMLKAKKQKEVDDLLEPMEERMARLFNCQVTA